MTEAERLERIQTVTRYFAYWQGMKLVPVGLMCLGLGVLTGLPASVNPVASSVMTLAVVAAGGLGYVFTSAGYKQRFGAVHNPRVNRRLDLLTIFVAIPLIWGALALDFSLRPPVFVTGLAYALFFVWVRWATGGGRPYYLWVAATVAVLSVLPLFGLGFGSLIQSLLIVLGLGTAAAGVLDHLELLRVFKPVEEDEHGTPA